MKHRRKKWLIAAGCTAAFFLAFSLLFPRMFPSLWWLAKHKVIKKMRGRDFSWHPAQSAMERGDYPEALQLIEGYFRDTFAKDYAASLGVRGTQGIAVWQSLNGVYPEARERMEEICGELERRLETGDLEGVEFDEERLAAHNPDGNPEKQRTLCLAWLMGELAMYNQALGRSDATLETYEKLEHERPDVANAAWNSVRPDVFGKRRYDMVARHVPDLQKAIAHEIASRSKLLRMYSTDGRDERHGYLEYLKQLMDFGLATGQNEIVANALDDIVLRNDFDSEDFRKYRERLDNEGQ